MSIEQIIVLALIQGITEFLPISSSGHAVLVPALLGWPDQGDLTDAVANLGTVAALIVYFWRDVVAMFRGLMDFARRETTADSQLVFHVIIGTIPIILVGLVLDITHIDNYLRSVTLIAINTIVFGILLYAADAYGLARRVVTDMNWKSALIIGIAQAFSLSKGTSRSGITITAARGLGFIRPEAARFSFLLSIPANGSASAFVIGKALLHHEPIAGTVILTAILTFFIALGTITFLMRIIRHMSFLPFVIYRVILGGALLGLIYSGMPFGTVN
jgi:undecaprenyl-diphosphatase